MYAKEHVIGHKMGVYSAISVTHIQGNIGRSESAQTNDIWQAVLKQEQHYKQYYNIDLSNYRKNMGLKNNTILGSVTGYLYR